MLVSGTTYHIIILPPNYNMCNDYECMMDIAINLSHTYTYPIFKKIVCEPNHTVITNDSCYLCTKLKLLPNAIIQC